MSKNRILEVRQLISIAQRNEISNPNLLKFLQTRLPFLHHAINLPSNEPEQSLMGFVSRYIEHVPDCIEALESFTKSAGIYDFANGFLTIAEDYFINPPELVQQHSGLHALIDKSYLAHRLIEEVNDRVMMACGIPLTPMDMTISNLIVHSLMEDEFANQLDMVVFYSVESQFDFAELENNAEFKKFMHQHQQEGWESVLAEWPCLAGDSSISIDLQDDIPPAQLH